MRKSRESGSKKPIQISKKKAEDEKTRLVFEDEASFRQDSTLSRTWSRIGTQPIVSVTGQRKSVKVFGCVDVHTSEFEYMMDDVFDAASYLVFLETTLSKMFENNRRIHYIHDGASYHRDGDIWYWFKDNRKWIEVYNLPAYSPEFNAVEPLWKYTRKEGTHNKNFESQFEVENTLHEVFEKIQKNPANIDGYLKPFL